MKLEFSIVGMIPIPPKQFLRQTTILENFNFDLEKSWKMHIKKVMKGMLHQGLKVKKLNNYSNFKSLVSELSGISL